MLKKWGIVQKIGFQGPLEKPRFWPLSAHVPLTDVRRQRPGRAQAGWSPTDSSHSLHTPTTRLLRHRGGPELGYLASHHLLAGLGHIPLGTHRHLNL